MRMHQVNGHPSQGNKVKGKTLLCILAIVSLIASMTTVNVAMASGLKVSLDMDPTTKDVVEPSIVDPTMGPGSSFTIGLVVDYVIEAWLYQFHLTFNPEVLKGVEVENGPFLYLASRRKPYDVLQGPGFDNEKGELGLFAAAFKSVQDTATGGSEMYGSLAFVTFEVVGIGESNITLGIETGLMNKTGGWQFYGEWAHGWRPKLPTDPPWFPAKVPNPDFLGNGYFDNRPEGFHAVEISIDPTSAEIKPGDTATYMATITNTGTLPGDVFDLSVMSTEITGKIVDNKIPPEWISLSEDNGTLDPGQSESVTLQITMPEDWAGMEDATYPFNITVTVRDEPEVSDTAEASLTVEATKRSIAEYVKHELQWLSADVESLGMNRGVKNSLLMKIDSAAKREKNALNHIIAGREKLANNMLKACENILNALIHEIEALNGKKIAETHASSLIELAQEIIRDIEETITTPIE